MLQSKYFKPTLLTLALAATAGAVFAAECAPNAEVTLSTHALAPNPDPQIVYVNPMADLLRMQAMLNQQLLGSFWMPVMLPPTAALQMPAVTPALLRTQDGYQLSLPLAGFKPEDIHVRLDGRTLTISAQTSGSGSFKVGQGTEQSQSLRSFAETLTLPGPVQAAALKQSFQNGVLTLSLPSQASSGPGKI